MSDGVPRKEPETIGFLLVPSFSMMAFVSAVEPLRAANRLGGSTLYRWEIVSRDGSPVPASNAMSLVAGRSLAEPAKYDKVVVCAGFEPERHYDKRIKSWLIQAGRGGAPLGAIDTGSFFLAWAGLLDGYRATTHWESLDSFREQFPKVEVDSGLFVFDRGRFTCAGGTAALDMMLHLITLRHGHRLAAAVSEQFIHAHIRDARERQRMEPKERQGVTDPRLARALAVMESHLEEPLGLDEICDAAGASRRQLERMFHRHFGMAPVRYYLELRLQRARALLQYSDLAVIEIAVACGFGSAAHFSRTYHSWAGKAPSAERQPKPAGIMPALR